MAERIVIISDTEIPYDDRKALKAVIAFIGAYQPDEVIHIGDLMDYPTPSRWTKGSARVLIGRHPDRYVRTSSLCGNQLSALRRQCR